MKSGFLLMNTGSPDAPTEAAVRVFLEKFLMDPHVIDLPWVARTLLVRGIILPRRPAESAKAYKKIWTKNGSPLVHYCTELANGLKKLRVESSHCATDQRFPLRGEAFLHQTAKAQCSNASPTNGRKAFFGVRAHLPSTENNLNSVSFRTGTLAAPPVDAPIELGMAYGKPSFKDAIERLLDSGIEEICLLPMFPHSAMATTGSCIESVEKEINHRAALRVVPPFYAEPSFIQPLADSLKDVDEHILFSYHGLPFRHLKKMDPPDYRVQCLETTKAVVAKASIPEERYSVSFQSRLGRAKWLEPYTEEMLRQLPAAGKKRLAVICPSFFCDCLETLEEIEIRGKETFMAAGGESFRMIPCLNDSPAAFQCLETLMADADRWPLT